MFSTLNVLSAWFNVFSLLISRASRAFLLYMFYIIAIIVGWIQLNCPWRSMVYSVTPDDSHLCFMLSCWCSMQRVNTFFFDSPIYLPLHEQFNWYTPGWLLGSILGLFWHKMLCKFLRDVKVMSLFTFLNYFLIFGLILAGIWKGEEWDSRQIHRFYPSYLLL